MGRSALWPAIAGVAGHSQRPAAGVPGAAAAGAAGTGRLLPRAGALLTVALAVMAAAAIMLRRRARPSGRATRSGQAPAGPAVAISARLQRTGRRRPPTATARHGSDTAGACGACRSATRAGGCCAAEDRHALVVFGPTQSGKSAGIAIPNILEWPGPAIVVSIKPDLLDATLTARASAARCSCSTRSACGSSRATPGRRWPAPAPGTARSRPRSGWPRPARRTPARVKGGELLVPGRRAATRPPAVRRRPHRPRDGRRRPVGVRAGRRRARPPHAPAHRPQPRRERARRRAARATTRTSRSPSSPARPAGRSRAPRRSCSPPTAPRPSCAPPTATRSPRGGCSTARTRCT